MITLPVVAANTTLPSFSKSIFPSGNYSFNSLQNNLNTPGSAEIQDRVNLRNQYSQVPNPSIKRQEDAAQNILTSYIDILQQQRRSQNLLNQSRIDTGASPAGSKSVLSQYQTLLYQQSSSDRMFQLKEDLFQNTLSTFV